jgi:hypothetical protein
MGGDPRLGSLTPAGRGGTLEATSELSQSEQRRELIAVIATAQHSRLRWRHVFVLSAALTAMTLCAVGLAGSFWPRMARVLGAQPTHQRELVPVFVVAYLFAGIFAAWAWARFDVPTAAQRLPRVLVLGAVGVFALLAIIWLQAGGGGFAGSYAAGLPGDFAEADLRGFMESGAPGRPLLRHPSATPTTLAAALVSRDDAAAIIGASVGFAEVPRRGLLRNTSLCHYRTIDRKSVLTIVVRRRLSALPRRRFRKYEPIAGLGEQAVASERTVYVMADGWLMILSVHHRNHATVDRAALIAGAKRAVALLPNAVGS